MFSFISEQENQFSSSPPVVDEKGNPVSASVSYDFEGSNFDHSMDVSTRSKEPLYAFTCVVGKKQSHAFTYVDDARDVSTLLLRLAGLNDSTLSDEAMAGIENE